MKSVGKVALIFVAFIFSLVGYLYIKTYDTQEHLSDNLNKLFLSHVKAIARNIDTYLHRYLSYDIYKTLKADEKLRLKLQNALEIAAADPHRYIYVLYRDPHGRYRYLLDGSHEDKGFFDQKLDVDIPMWDRAYKSGEDQIISHKDSQFLAITYLHPLHFGNRVEAILAIDFTSALPRTIGEVLSPLRDIFLYIFIAFVLLVLVLLYQLYLYLVTKKRAITDPLTNVYNRTFMKGFVDNLDPHNYAILMIDIDHFKKINDNYGHKAGDFILKQAANTIKASLRDDDVIIRYGGEEFLVFLKHPASDADVLKIAERIRTTFERAKFIFDGHPIKVTVSIGMTLHPQRYRTIKEAIKNADEQLYSAKRGGRNRISYKEEALKKEGDEMISMVKEAIENDRLFCHYQPIYDIATKKPVKYEALVRLEVNRKIIFPGEFLEQIAFTTVYTQLTKKVLEVVFSAIDKYRKPISVNLNFSDISDNVIYQNILETLQKNSELAHYLTIELLENEIIEDPDAMRERLHRFKELGIAIAIDDFGSGYSNFEIFRHLPIDILKVDGSLIRELPESKISLSMTKAIMLFAKENGITTVAEFVENREIFEILRDLGFDYAQGFYLSRPLASLDDLH